MKCNRNVKINAADNNLKHNFITRSALNDNHSE